MIKFRGYKSIKDFCQAKKIVYLELRLLKNKKKITTEEAADILIKQKENLKKAVEANRNNYQRTIPRTIKNIIYDFT